MEKGSQIELEAIQQIKTIISVKKKLMCEAVENYFFVSSINHLLV